jgi:uncharacterized membrane protein HdeD (DUF308 family)
MSSILNTVRNDIKNWWWFLIIGLLSVAAGVAIFSKPVESYVSLSILFSLVMVGTGISQIIFALSVSAIMRGWGWTLVSGIFDLAIGTYLLMHPTLTMATLPYIVGFYLIFRAIYIIGTSIDFNYLGVTGWGWLLVGGIVLFALGILTLLHPAVGAAGIVGASGTAFIVSGILSIVLAFQLKNLKSLIEKPEREERVKIKGEREQYAH